MLSDYFSLPFSRTIGSVKDHLQFWTDFQHHFVSVPSDPLYKALDFAHKCWWRPFPQFGGVLLALSDGGSTVDLIVCVLDAWEHVCQTDATREAQHDSLSRKHTVYCAGSVNEGLLPQLEEILQGMLAKGGKGGHGGEKKHHWTGGFLASRVSASIDVVCSKSTQEEILPLGGTRDVGRHTGVQPVRTEAALVPFALLDFLLQRDGTSILYYWPAFFSWAAHRRWTSLQSTCSRAEFEDFLAILHSELKTNCLSIEVRREIVKLLDQVETHLEESFGVEVSQCLIDHANAGPLVVSVAKVLELRRVSTLGNVFGLTCEAVEVSSHDDDSIRADCCESENFADVLKWLQGGRFKSKSEAYFGFQEGFRAFCRICVRRFRLGDPAFLDPKEVEDAFGFLKEMNRLFGTFRDLNVVQYSWDMELRSRCALILVTYTFWCCSHASCMKLFPGPLEGLSSPLNCDRFRELVLSGSAERELASMVFQYLVRLKGGKPFFQCNVSIGKDGTELLFNRLGTHYSAHLAAPCAEVRKHVTKSLTDWFTVVETKQSSIAEFRLQIRECQRRLSTSGGLARWERNHLYDEVARLERQISGLEHVQSVAFSLPDTRHSSLRIAILSVVLWELCPPILWLLRFATVAQNAVRDTDQLFPMKSSVELEWCYGHPSISVGAGKVGHVKHGNADQTRKVYVPGVTEMFDGADFRDWSGETYLVCDVNIAAEQGGRPICSSFEAAEEIRDFLWSPPKEETGDRQNRGMATNHAAKFNMDRTTWKRFTNVRSTEILQLPRLAQLIDASAQISACLTRPHMQRLVVLVIDQLGVPEEISVGEDWRKVWKTSFILMERVEESSFVQRVAVKLLADLEQSKRNHLAVDCSARLANFLALFFPGLRDFLRNLAQCIDQEWTDNHGSSLEDRIALLQYRGLAGLCHAVRDVHLLHAKDAMGFARAFVSAYQAAALAGKGTEDDLVFRLRDISLSLSLRSCWTTVLPCELDFIIGPVVSNIQTKSVEWASGSAPVLLGVALTGEAIRVDLRSGSVLVNGRPPSTFPAEIRKHSLFQRTFGEWDAEVVQDKDDFFRTCNGPPFRLRCTTGHLVVYDESLSSSLLLLDSSVCIHETRWPSFFHAYSHWLYLDRFVIFRPRLALGDLSRVFAVFDIHCERLYKANGVSLFDLSASDWTAVKESSFLVDARWSLNLLERLEAKENIFCWQSVDSTLMWELPRYKLCFYLEQGLLRICEFPTTEHVVLNHNYETSQLLPRANSYLVLQNGGNSQQVRVTFSWQYGGTCVEFRCSLGWHQSRQMRKDSNGVWFLELPVPGGFSLRYKFLVDGRWCYDQAREAEDDEHGGLNNVLQVPVADMQRRVLFAMRQFALNYGEQSCASFIDHGFSKDPGMDVDVKWGIASVHPCFQDFVLLARSSRESLFVAALLLGGASRSFSNYNEERAMMLINDAYEGGQCLDDQEQEMVRFVLTIAHPYFPHVVSRLSRCFNLCSLDALHDRLYRASISGMLNPNVVNFANSVLLKEKGFPAGSGRDPLSFSEMDLVIERARACRVEGRSFSTQHSHSLISYPQVRTSLYDFENALSARFVRQVQVDASPFPLQDLPENEFVNELRQSWQIDSLTLRDELIPGSEMLLLEEVQRAALHFRKQRLLIERDISTLLRFRSTEPVSLRLLQLIASGPMRTFATRLGNVAPHVSHMAADILSSICCWMEVKVLEDRLSRINHLLREDDKQGIVKELCCVRSATFFAIDEPHWAAFEVWMQLSVWPIQAKLAKFLATRTAADANNFVQLNMGLGKTRVILPLILLKVLEAGEIPRVFFLSSLIREGVEALSCCFSRSPFRIAIVPLPFSRETLLGENSAKELIAAANRFSGRCVIVTTPEWVESLLLAGDLSDDCKDVSVLQQWCTLDIFDEIDASLHPRKQLLYADGRYALIQSSRTRFICSLYLLRLLLVPHPDLPDLWDKINAASSWVLRDPARHVFVFLPVEEARAQWPQLSGDLVRGFVRYPPFDARWMVEYFGPSEKVDQLVRVCVEDMRANVREVFSDLTPARLEWVFLLRGLLLMGILGTALRGRPRVEYGRPTGGKDERGREMAVAYSACDQPKNRSEFAQPEIAIVRTCMAFFEDGLSEVDVKEALVRFIVLPTSQQWALWKDWLEAAPMSKFPLDGPTQVDVSNASQFRALFQVLHRNVGFLSWHLSDWVLPRNVIVHEMEWACGAWDIANRGKAIGFSGTNDAAPLLPMCFRQDTSTCPSLAATNGHMLRCVFERGIEVVSCSTGPELQELALSGVFSVIIDAAGLLVELGVKALADSALRSGKFDLVVFFSDLEASFVYIGHGRHGKLSSAPFSVSPIPRSVLCILDQAHCRGSDLRLERTAVGLVTVSMNVQKDALMQAVGRLRRLTEQEGQRVVFAASKEINISDGVKSVIRAVIFNTVREFDSNYALWLDQGARRASVGRCARKRVDALSDMYGMLTGSPMTLDSFVNFWQNESGGGAIKSPEMLEALRALSRMDVHPTSLANLEGECELEAQLEVEQQSEVEVEVRSVSPLTAEPGRADEYVRGRTKTLDSMSLFSSFLLSIGLDVLCGSAAHLIFVSSDFARSVSTCGEVYTRALSVVIYDEEQGRVVLVSEAEAELAFSVPLKERKRAVHVLQLSPTPSKDWEWKEDHSAQEAAVRVFGGQTCLPSRLRHGLMEAFAGSKVKAREAIVRFCGMPEQWPRSSLDEWLRE